MRLAMPDQACTGINIQSAQTGRITEYNGRIVDVTNPAHERAMREQGAFPVNIGGRTTSGYRCACGFRPFFSTCSRCGAACHKET